LTTNIRHHLLIYYGVWIGRVLPSGKGYSGLLMQPEWAMLGKWGMGEKLSSGRTNGLGALVLQFNIWELYSIIIEKGKTIEQAWDGVNFIFPFAGQ
jgi:hypothetical protein